MMIVAECYSRINKVRNIINKILLGHLSDTNNYPDLAYQTVLNVLE